MPRLPPSLPALARFAAGVLDAVGVQRAHVLGVSFGGLVAQQVAAAAPRRVDRLVLASTSAGVLHVPGEPSALLGLLAPWLFAGSPGLRDAGPVFGGRIRRQPELLARLGLEPPRSLPAYLYRLGGLTGWTVSGLTGWTGPPWSIRRPTLVLTGDDDPIVPPSNSRILAACLPDARLHVVRGGGHLVLFDSPGEVAPVIAGFLAGAGEHRPDASVGTLGS